MPSVDIDRCRGTFTGSSLARRIAVAGLWCLAASRVQAEEWTFGSASELSPWTSSAAFASDPAAGLRLLVDAGCVSSVDAPDCVPADRSYAFEVDVSYRFTSEKRNGWFGMVVARRDSEDPGLLLYQLDSGTLFLFDRRKEIRLGGYRPTRPQPERGPTNDEWRRTTVRMTFRRGDERCVPSVIIEVNGWFVGERLLPEEEYASAGVHCYGLAVCDDLEAVVHRATLVDVPAAPYPHYAVRGPPPPVDDPFPRSASPASVIYRAQIADRPFEEIYLGVVLQGLVNRRQPRILTDFHGYESVQVGDRDWSHLVRDQGRRIVNGKGVAHLLERFRDVVAGVALYESAWVHDPERKPWIHVVTNACALDDLVPMTPGMYSTMGTRLGLAVEFDARGRWTSGRDAIAWSARNQLPRCSRRGLVHLPVHGPNFALLDYAVANRFFTFMSSAYRGTEEEYRGYERILSHTTPCTPVLGMSYLPRLGGPPVQYLGESVVFGLCGEMGKYFLYAMNCGNLSYHSGVRTTPEQSPVDPVAYDPARVYVCFLSSDGDNSSWSMNLRLRIDGHPSRGRHPLAWTFPPSLAYLCPDVTAYHYARAPRGERYVASGGGIGILPYTHSMARLGLRLAPEDREPVANALLAISDRAFRQADIAVSNPFCTDRGGLEAMAHALPSVRLFLPGYNVRNAGRPRAERIYKTRAGSWVAHTWWGHPGGSPAEMAERYAATILDAAAEGERFIPIWCLGNTFIRNLDVLNTTMDALDDRFVAVGPEQFADLLDQEEDARVSPGERVSPRETE